MANMMDAIKYVQENKLEKEANNLANEVGDIYMACVMLFHNVPQNKENISACKKIVEDRKRKDHEYLMILLGTDEKIASESII